ncbi:multidrug ABC transporter ATP-binding protein [Nibricoccus aquaticus]|uniref:Multidrug ABC transporter ATP-binding protein n=1 Tax=Nibricoccus aquaticus TaxID=2576891 RepID=A0A290QG04_9BACT|nr:multidrug ABC transporter ATP-binding protein [Nibricoccus aquaticus]
MDRAALRETVEILRYLKPYRRRFVFGLLCLLVGSVAGLCFPLLAGGLIDAALHSTGVTLPVLGSLTLNGIAAILAGTIAVQALGSAGAAMSFGRVGQTALADLRRDTYGRMIGLPMEFFARRRVGELTSRLSGDIAQLESGLISAVPQLCRQTVLLIGGLVLIALTSGKLTLAMLCTVPLLIAAAVTFGRKLRRLSREAQDRLAETGTIVEETLQGIASVKAFANETFELARYQRTNEAALATSLTAVRWRAAFFAVFTVSMFGGMVIVLWFGAGLLQSGQITAGELTRFVLYSTFVAGAMGQAAELYSQIQKTVGASQRVRELLREQPEVTVALPAATTPKTAATITVNRPIHPSSPPSDLSTLSPQLSTPPSASASPTRLRGEVELQNVTFRYPSRPEIAVLADISLHARPGEVTALVGPSGAGKSTLTALLYRFYAPEHGRVLFDGRDAHDFDLTALREQMALVPQDVLLFGGSIAENIRYGKPGATLDEIKAAAQQANAAEFIDRFPEGYDTIVGDRGIKLSGGQRQRVAIARAILKDPAILVLDEATSSLDSESERLVQSALEHLMRGRTTFVIAHRLATVRRADQIVVLDQGRMVERGTHEELSQNPDGLYRRLSTLQFQHALAE